MIITFMRTGPSFHPQVPPARVSIPARAASDGVSHPSYDRALPRAVELHVDSSSEEGLTSSAHSPHGSLPRRIWHRDAGDGG
ncbi:unnamed protein product [Vitrella brassicaformis CCMP3155]|uniref:Uncharacterized protein n=1 Tax=Vitrella brassicaformis (strain CCMP3155) TaxID=1169540 RepID=A0A0G4FT00_VITBC|nr:unnamed protein product [Vitrella brassicaformis CCMP3155]|eukprot:CEM17612.1 unnamed protein product [Vitrella brassicaformis CCMP3155]